MVLLCTGYGGLSRALILHGFGTNVVNSRTYSSLRATSKPRLSLYREYSLSKARQGIGREVTTRLQSVNEKYEGFLKRRFPRFYVLYHTFKKGFQLLFQDANEVKMIKMRMITQNIQVQDLPYRDMEKLRKVVSQRLNQRDSAGDDLYSSLCQLPGFCTYLLIPQFWTPHQQADFQVVYHSHRAQHYGAVLQRLKMAGSNTKDGHLQRNLQDLCSKVQRGVHPNGSEILALRGLFSGPPLDINRLSADHMRHLSPVLFLTHRLPSFLIGHRLRSHTLELLQLDRALSKLGLHQLSDSELRQACYTRGLNSDILSLNQRREWLSNWLQLSTRLKESEISLLLHSMVLLSANYPKHNHH
ncbi:LETM1 domain-containing protein 1 isoform X2 [Osmerus eperlanus]|uniref:LETM1 domain-containing protein 1 isoform X2 n=1 Tax=Osmerus eperlanus TaxID=29151 RepID=UPI002E0FA59B